MTTISLFEHQPLSLSGDDAPLRAVHLRHLERLNQQAGVDLVKLGYRQIRATAYVGVIQLGQLTLQILPKVDQYGRDEGGDPASVASAAANLLWLLFYAGELPVHENELAVLLKQRANLFELLVRIFCQRLAEQLQRGLYRAYERREETLPVLKGRWLLSRHLREQPLTRDKFPVAYDEFSADNPLNRVLGYTVAHLHRLTRSVSNRQRLDGLRLWFDEVRLPARITPQDLERVTFSRLNAAYEPIFHLARMFLAQEALQLQAGHLPTFTFLFDINLLFERFVAGFLRRHRTEALPEMLQACDILIQGQGKPCWLARTAQDRSVFRLKPDIVLRRPDQQIALIIDTKYKTQSRITETDAYQMYVYANRYRCADVLLLYPEAQMQPQTFYISPPQPPTRLRSQTLNLRRDLSQPNRRRELALELAHALKGDP